MVSRKLNNPVSTIQDKLICFFPCQFDIEKVAKLCNTKHYTFFLFFSINLYTAVHKKSSKWWKISFLTSACSKINLELMEMISHHSWASKDLLGHGQGISAPFCPPGLWLKGCCRLVSGGCDHQAPSSAEPGQVCLRRLRLDEDS